MAQAIDTASVAIGADPSTAQVAALASAVAQVPALACLAWLQWRVGAQQQQSQQRFLEAIERIVAGRPA